MVKLVPADETAAHFIVLTSLRTHCLSVRSASNLPVFTGESMRLPLLIHHCPLVVVQVSWFGLSNDVNTPLMWKLDTTMWWRQTGSSRVNRETRGPFDVRNARHRGKQEPFGEVGWNAHTCMYCICTEVWCVCVCEREREQDKEGNLHSSARVSEIGCVCVHAWNSFYPALNLHPSSSGWSEWESSSSLANKIRFMQSQY